mmetsp:Transcript_18205/g.28691  ORF Transcript_18205/g.28691 Transcript_18205/m.28691 type:complete len:224 (-) Transcript_18205:162-833(-)
MQHSPTGRSSAGSDGSAKRSGSYSTVSILLMVSGLAALAFCNMFCIHSGSSPFLCTQVCNKNMPMHLITNCSARKISMKDEYQSTNVNKVGFVVLQVRLSEISTRASIIQTIGKPSIQWLNIWTRRGGRSLPFGSHPQKVRKKPDLQYGERRVKRRYDSSQAGRGLSQGSREWSTQTFNAKGSHTRGARTQKTAVQQQQRVVRSGNTLVIKLAFDPSPPRRCV